MYHLYQSKNLSGRLDVTTQDNRSTKVYIQRVCLWTFFRTCPTVNLEKARAKLNGLTGEYDKAIRPSCPDVLNQLCINPFHYYHIDCVPAREVRVNTFEWEGVEDGGGMETSSRLLSLSHFFFNAKFFFFFFGLSSQNIFAYALKSLKKVCETLVIGEHEINTLQEELNSLGFHPTEQSNPKTI